MLDEAVEEKMECYLEQKKAVPKKTETMLRSKQKTESIKAKRNKRKALYLDSGQTHMVWKPTRQDSKKNIGFTDIESRQDLLERQQKLQSRVMATQQVLKVHKDELAVVSDEEKAEGVEVGQPMSKERKQKSIKKEAEDNAKTKKKRSKRSVHFHETVSKYVATMTTPTHDGADKATAPGFRQWKSQFIDGEKETDTWKRCYSESSIPMREMGSSKKSDTIVTRSRAESKEV